MVFTKTHFIAKPDSYLAGVASPASLGFPLSTLPAACTLTPVSSFDTFIVSYANRFFRRLQYHNSPVRSRIYDFTGEFVFCNADLTASDLPVRFLPCAHYASGFDFPAFFSA